MKIPVANIYYLLCYAWDHLEEREVVDVRAEDETELVNLFARVLGNGLRHLLRRGIDRGYVAHEDAVAGIRGKLVFSETLKRNLFSNARAWCSFDDLTANVLHNQILKATLNHLLHRGGLDLGLKEEIRDLVRRLAFVSDVDLSASHFRRVQLHRNIGFYDFLIKICRFLFDNFMIDERSGDARFRDFERDERQMRYLFQNFALNFFRRELSTTSVSTPQIEWFDVDRSEESVSTLPLMNTDIVLRRQLHTIIIDTKFTPKAFETRYDVERARSAHLYQIFAYVKNYALRYPGQQVKGMLLYPVVDEPFSCDYPLHAQPISIRSIDLRNPWRQIERDMKSLIDWEDEDVEAADLSAQLPVRTTPTLSP